LNPANWQCIYLLVLFWLQGSLKLTQLSLKCFHHHNFLQCLLQCQLKGKSSTRFHHMFYTNLHLNSTPNLKNQNPLLVQAEHKFRPAATTMTFDLIQTLTTNSCTPASKSDVKNYADQQRPSSQNLLWVLYLSISLPGSTSGPKHPRELILTCTIFWSCFL